MLQLSTSPFNLTEQQTERVLQAYSEQVDKHNEKVFVQWATTGGGTGTSKFNTFETVVGEKTICFFYAYSLNRIRIMFLYVNNSGVGTGQSFLAYSF